MTDQQAQDLIAATQQLHADNLTLLALASTQAGYIMHLHELCCWLVFVVVIFGLALVAMLRPRGV